MSNGAKEQTAANAATNASNNSDDLSLANSLESVTSIGQTRIKHLKPDVANLRNEVNIEEHKMTIEQVVAKFDSHLTQGISGELAKIRLDRNGPNSLTPPKPVSEWRKFAKHLFSGFSLLLWVGALLCVIAYCIEWKADHIILGVILALVVILTAGFQYYQERKSASIMESFKKLVPTFATVIRNGVKDTVHTESLVVGDLVEVNAGDRIPADLRIVRANQMRVDNSSLTGESEPQSRTNENTNDNPLESKCLAFYSSNCVDGTGVGIVIATGDNTVMGRIAGLTARLETNETPIAREIDHFIRIITLVACSVGIIFFVLAMLNGYKLLDAFVFLIGVIVANVPEGLIATVTVCLTLTAKRMAARKCLVKNLEAVETLGSTSVICSDKTGTLTRNMMTVSHGWYDCHMGKFDLLEARRIRLRDARSLAWLCLTRSAKLCSRARFKPMPAGEKLPIRRWPTTGDASESAILKWLEGDFGGVVEYRDRQKKVAEIPFNSSNKYALAVYDITENRAVMSKRARQIVDRKEERSRSRDSNRSANNNRKSNTSPANNFGTNSSSSGTNSAGSSNVNTVSPRVSNVKRETSAEMISVAADLQHNPSGGNVILEQQGGKLVRQKPTKYGKLMTKHTLYTGEELVHLMQPQLDNLDKHCRYLVVMKGAPERVLERCSSIIINNEVRPIDAKIRASFAQAYEDMGGLGERVMGFADLPLPVNEFDANFKFSTDNINFPVTGMRFLGLVSMIDPPRASVPNAVQKCRDAGIRVIMITGDHPITAQAIARAVGIFSDKAETVVDIAKRLNTPVENVDPKQAVAAVVHGSELREMSKEQLDELLAIHPEVVFARTSPQQKLSIVEACQRAGAVVAVTGDGVNDSPALKKADIGIAMGITGSDMSKQASDLILLDDNFASIVYGVEEGRRIFDNLKKSITYTITSNIPEVLPFIIYVIVGIPLPLGTVCILWIDLVTDMVPAISLAYEKAENDIMKRKPRDAKNDRLVNRRTLQLAYLQTGIFQAAAGFFTYFVLMNDHGWKPKDLYNIKAKWSDEKNNALLDSYRRPWTFEARRHLEHACQSAFFVTIVVMQWANLLVCKSRKLSLFEQGMNNHFLHFGLIFETLITAVLCYVPGTKALNMWPINGVYWLTGMPFALVAFVLDELRKLALRKYPGGFYEQFTYY